MMGMAEISQRWFLGLGTACVVVVTLVYLRLRLASLKRSPLPPGPRPWPVIGNILHFGKIPHKSLSELSKKYGPMMLLKLGSTPVLIVSSPDTAREVLETHGELFSSRPTTLGGEIMAYDHQAIVSVPHGSNLKLLRKIMSMDLLSPKRVQQFKDVRRDEILNTVRNILEEGKDGQPVELSKKLVETNNNNITRMLFTKTYCGLKASMGEKASSDSQKFRDLVQKTTEYGLEFFVGDYIPFLRLLDLKGLKTRMWEVRRGWDDFLESIIKQHRESKDLKDSKRVQDFVDVLISVQENQGKDFTDERMKGLLQNLVSGGTESSASQTAWAMVEVVHYPEIQKNLQEELDLVVGRERMVDESDIPNLPYLQAVLKESFRLHPVVPLLLPHASINTQPVEIRGYKIPPKTTLFVNAYSIQRDPSVWEDPLKFDPQRFLTSSIDVKGRHFELLPFGSGRRICPGLNVAVLMVHLSVAQLVHAFQWDLADSTDSELLEDMEDYRGGFNLPRPISYKITPRVPSHLFSG